MSKSSEGNSASKHFLDWERVNYPNMKTRDTQRYASKEQRAWILNRDQHSCRYCGCSLIKSNMDHVKPWKHGGKTQVQNLVAACPNCNRLKGNKAWVEPLPVSPHPHDKHRRTGCRKDTCPMRHHVLHQERVVQGPCQHRQSPNCLRRTCLEARKQSAPVPEVIPTGGDHG